MKNTAKSFLFLLISILVLTTALHKSPLPTKAAGILFVAPGGNDGNTCINPSFPCATIQGAIDKAATNDIIKVATGIYTAGGMKVVTINKDITLSGGWSSDFANQDGTSIVNGENLRQGIMIDGGITALIEHFIVQNGYADGVSESFGGILNSGNLTLSYSTVRYNDCDGNCWAGGIFNYHGSLIIQWSSIIGNESSTGGGITNFSDSTLTVKNSLITQNQSDSGSGIFNLGSLSLLNSTISHNTTRAGGQGGGIYNFSGTLTILNSTVTFNEGGQSGGGIYFSDMYGGKTILQNTVLADNTANTTPDCYGNIDSSGYNIIGDTTGCSFSDTTGDQLNIDPKLGPIQDNGGPTLTHWLYEGSPAIDGGDPSGCTDLNGNPLTTDQRGLTRPLDGDSNGDAVCDIGAYEADPDNLPPPPPESLWYVRPTGSDTNDCHTPVTACATINGAIGKATSGDTVYVSTGVYTAAVGDEVVLIDKNIDLLGGWNTSFTTQIGLSTIDGEYSRRGITVNEQITANLEDFNIQNGLSPYPDNGGYGGGGLYIGWRSKVTLSDSMVQANTAGDLYLPPSNSNGGGIGMNNYGSLTLNHSFVIENTAYGSGGGIYSGGSVLTLNDSIVSSNTAGERGGGVSGGLSGQIELINSSVINNTSLSEGGGGINSLDNTLILFHTSVTGNDTPGQGGGILGRSMTIEKSFVGSNKAGSGGGIYSQSESGIVDIKNSAILHNKATYGNGGGIYSGANLVLNNTTIAYNKAEMPYTDDADGGGIFRSNGYIQASNTTIVGNVAEDSGGGIWFNSGSIVLRNILLAKNLADVGPDCVGTIDTNGYNLIGDVSDCSFIPAIGDLTNIDPRIAFLYGWPPAVALRGDSPAIDGGNPGGCIDQQGNPITFDQIGTIRPQDGNGDTNFICDIGAYEYDPAHLPNWLFMPAITR